MKRVTTKKMAVCLFSSRLFNHKVKADNTLLAAVQHMRVPGPCMLLTSICFALALISFFFFFPFFCIQCVLHHFSAKDFTPVFIEW